MKARAYISLFLLLFLVTTPAIALDLSQALSFRSQQNYVADNSEQEECSEGSFDCPHT